MASSVSFACFLGFFLCFLMVGYVESRNFHELFQPSWAFDHFIYEGELLKLRLDNSSGTLIILFTQNLCLPTDFTYTNELGSNVELWEASSFLDTKKSVYWNLQVLGFHPRASICLGGSQSK